VRFAVEWLGKEPLTAKAHWRTRQGQCGPFPENIDVLAGLDTLSGLHKHARTAATAVAAAPVFRMERLILSIIDLHTTRSEYPLPDDLSGLKQTGPGAAIGLAHVVDFRPTGSRTDSVKSVGGRDAAGRRLA
jgi:hypothetical protein